MHKYILFLVILACIAIIVMRKTSSKSALIPRSVLFSNPERAMPRLSPDGAKLAYLANGKTPQTETKLNIWVKSIKKNDDQQVTFDENRSITSYWWDFTGKEIYFVQDMKGDENWNLYGVDLETKKTTNYTPFENVHVKLVAYTKQHPEVMLLAINKDNKELHDVYSFNIKTKKLTKIEANPGNVTAWLADNDLHVKAGVAQTPQGTKQLLIKKDGTWQSVIEWGSNESESCGPESFNQDGTALYLSDSRNTDTVRLVKYNLSDGSTEVVYEDPEYDISDVHMNSDTHELEAISIKRDKTDWVFFGKEYKAVIDAVCPGDKANVHVVSASNDKSKWLIALEYDSKPLTYYLYDRNKKKKKLLFCTRPDLAKYTLSTMRPIAFKSRDGLTIHGYITLPSSTQQKNLPMVLNVHGGPWARDNWGFDAVTQWLANRGYAVLQINYRGSIGYGKSFVRAGDKEWGNKMHNDLIDAVNWAVNEGIADRTRIAIYGGSYGGYAALIGATMTPDVFACAVDIVGVSNLLTFMNSIPLYWKPYLEYLYQTVGNPHTETEFLKERSPINHIKNIKSPLLIAQGKHDPRVNVNESEQIVKALKDNNIPVTYLLFEDEGHGFIKPENKMTFFCAAEKFLAQHLGGLCE